jgi:hypothetical protein
MLTPLGYDVSTSSDVQNGPISRSEFDKMAGAGASTDLGFVAGYHVTYDSQTSSDYIDVALITTTSPSQASADATLFADALLAENNAQSPVRRPYPDISNAIEIQGTKLDSGSVDDAVIVATGAIILTVDYSTDHTGPSSQDLKLAAISQYDRLPG